MNQIILTVSPQGQITIPKIWRDQLKLKSGVKVIAWIEEKLKTKILTLIPHPKNWTDIVAGSGKGMWGNSDEYIQNERNQWK